METFNSLNLLESGLYAVGPIDEPLFTIKLTPMVPTVTDMIGGVPFQGYNAFNIGFTVIGENLGHEDVKMKVISRFMTFGSDVDPGYEFYQCGTVSPCGILEVGVDLVGAVRVREDCKGFELDKCYLDLDCSDKWSFYGEIPVREICQITTE